MFGYYPNLLTKLENTQLKILEFEVEFWLAIELKPGSFFCKPRCPTMPSEGRIDPFEENAF